MTAAYTPPPPTRLRWLPGIQALRTCLALALVASTLAALWSWPRDGSSEALLRAVAVDDVRTWAVGDVRVDDRTWAVTRGARGSGVVWQDGSYRTHVTPASQEVDAALHAESNALQADGPAPPLRGLGVLASLLALVLLVRGRQPALATKWAWFWLGVVPPLSVGVLLWLAVEVPWSRRTPPAGPRLSGGRALAGAALAYLVLHTLLQTDWA